jgi:hypothetical protein
VCVCVCMRARAMVSARLAGVRGGGRRTGACREGNGAARVKSLCEWFLVVSGRSMPPTEWNKHANAVCIVRRAPEAQLQMMNQTPIALGGEMQMRE